MINILSSKLPEKLESWCGSMSSPRTTTGRQLSRFRLVPIRDIGSRRITLVVEVRVDLDITLEPIRNRGTVLVEMSVRIPTARRPMRDRRVPVHIIFLCAHMALLSVGTSKFRENVSRLPV
jgi:hypothetical protein